MGPAPHLQSGLNHASGRERGADPVSNVRWNGTSVHDAVEQVEAGCLRRAVPQAA